VLAASLVVQDSQPNLTVKSRTTEEKQAQQQSFPSGFPGFPGNYSGSGFLKYPNIIRERDLKRIAA